MEVLFIFGSILLIVALVRCIYNTMEKSTETMDETQNMPTLEDTLVSLLKLFKGHLHKFTICSDKIIIYCFKNSPEDDISDFNEIKVRYCDMGFKSIPIEDCPQLQEDIANIINS